MAADPRTILHLDMDAFYAAVEQRDCPELRGRPVIVGAPPDRRGVVATASYEARRFGVHSALPSRTAYKRCPHAVFLPARMAHYQAVSAQVMDILRSFTPVVEQVSIDEAFLDCGSVMSAWPSPAALARALQDRIRSELALTASVGVAFNKFLAKLASDLRKPDGLTVVPAAEAALAAFLAPLPVTKIWGVGAATAQRLEQRGLRRIGQLQALSPAELAPILGAAAAYHVWRLAHGRDTRPVHAAPRPEKSISAEETFPQDCRDSKLVEQTLLELAEKVGRRLRRADKHAGVVQVKIRFADFRTITRQRALPAPASSDRELLGEALALYRKEQVCEPVRLIGFGVSRLDPRRPSAAPQQPLLFTSPSAAGRHRDTALDRAVDELRDKYGPRILRRGDWSQ